MKNDYSLILTDSLTDCSLDYDNLSGSVKNLMDMHRDLEQRISSIKTPFHKAYARLKKVIFGNPKHSVEEVMDMQLMIIRQIRRGLELQANKTRHRLGTMVSYSEGIDSQIENSLQYRAQESPILTSLKKELEAKRLDLEKQDKTKQGYFKKEQESKDLLRGYREKLHHYDLATDAAIDLLQQRKYLMLQEEIVRNTVHTSERLAEKTKRIENQIAIIKGMYDSALKQHKLYMALYQALINQKDYIGNLDNILVAGQQAMVGIATRSQALNAFHSNHNLESVAGLLEDSNSDIRSDKELTLADYLI